MKRTTLLLLAALFLAPELVMGQEDEESPADSVEPHTPWTHALTLGATPWPTSKERLRLGFHWQAVPNREWVHELAYIEAVPELFSWDGGFGEDRIGTLRGAQLKNEIRFYHNKKHDGPAYWYHGLGLAYMYTTHSISKGMECEEEGWGCAYFQRYDGMAAHTSTLTGNFGLMLTTGGLINFNFYTNLGLRGSHFPEVTSPDYFGRGPMLLETDHVILIPYGRLGVSLMFMIGKRKH